MSPAVGVHAFRKSKANFPAPWKRQGYCCGTSRVESAGADRFSCDFKGSARGRLQKARGWWRATARPLTATRLPKNRSAWQSGARAWQRERSFEDPANRLKADGFLARSGFGPMSRHRSMISRGRRTRFGPVSSEPAMALAPLAMFQAAPWISLTPRPLICPKTLQIRAHGFHLALHQSSHGQSEFACAKNPHLRAAPMRFGLSRSRRKNKPLAENQKS